MRAGTKSCGTQLSQSYVLPEATISELLSLLIKVSGKQSAVITEEIASHIPTLVSEVGEEASTPASKAALLNNQFAKNFNSSIPPLSKEDLPRLSSLHSDDSLF